VTDDTPPAMTFADLGLGPQALTALAACGYTTPTPIQQKAIPHILAGRDVVGLAQTGTGKTAGFTLPMIEILADGRARALMPRSLVLAPTRELAAQVAESFARYAAGHALSHVLITGGTSMDAQIKSLQAGVDVLIATPGRLLDLMERGRVRLILTDIKILVIDEADRMMDMGFIPDIEKIVARLPATGRRQTLLFSATMPKEIRRLVDTFLSNPKDVSVAAVSSAADTVAQRLLLVGPRSKKTALLALLAREGVESAFIFCNRKRDIDPLAKHLTEKGHPARALHGDMDQSARTATLAAFKAGEVRLLVCSDVAGRGIDVSGISHVVNYDLPFHAEDYVHRIGRTGRAGASGQAWSLATEADGELLGAIEKLIGRPIPRADAKTGALLDGAAPEPKARSEPEARPRPAEQAAPDQGPDTQEGEQPKRRRSRGGRGRRKRGADGERAQAAAPQEPPHAPPQEKGPAPRAAPKGGAPKGGGSKGGGSKGGGPKRPPRGRDTDSGPKGFGGDMPGFFALGGGPKALPAPQDETDDAGDET